MTLYSLWHKGMYHSTRTHTQTHTHTHTQREEERERKRERESELLLHCVIPLVKVDCFNLFKDTNCYHETSSSYTGAVSQTRAGLQCQRWDSQSPHQHIYNKTELFIDGRLPENYCRNVLVENLEPWCYTTDPHTRWGYCDVTKCEGNRQGL